MKSTLITGTIPGTTLDREKMSGVTGKEFLDKVFYVTDRIMLSQIREITDIDGTTLQNWIKRGWVENPEKKTYSKEQLARILLINMMRDTVQFSRVMYLFDYVKGDDGERAFSSSALYGAVCSVLDEVNQSTGGINGLDETIASVLASYKEPAFGTKKRITNAIRVIVVAYYATTMKATADYMLSSLGAEEGRR